MKQAIVVRKDLKMGCGKIAGQVAHASVRGVIMSKESDRNDWMVNGETKIVLKVHSEEDLLNIIERCKHWGVNYATVRDMGKTQIDFGTLTCVALGPHVDGMIDEIVGDLKLL